jgi:hypothetical protein
MTRLHSGLTGLGLGAVAVIAGLAACGPAHSPASPTTAATASPVPTASSAPTSSPTPAPPAPLVVTFRDAGPSGAPWTAVQLSLVGEDGAVEATYLDVGGPYGDSYAVGSDYVYFIDGTMVKALARDGTVTEVGYVPQVSTTVTADDLQGYTSLAVSPDESTFVFGIPLAMLGDNGATSDHSQLWTEPVGSTTAAATMVYDDRSTDQSVVMPVGWTSAGVLVSNRPTEGLGGAGPFLDYTYIDASTFDPSTDVMTPVHGSCFVANEHPVAPSAGVQICQTSQTVLTVDTSAGTRTVTMVPASATGFGSLVVSDDGRYLAYGSYIGDYGSGHYMANVVDIDSGATVATVQGYTPMRWLNDDRLVVSPSFADGSTYLLSASFANPVKLSADQPTGALP